jgi:hypothetical protein
MPGEFFDAPRPTRLNAYTVAETFLDDDSAISPTGRTFIQRETHTNYAMNILREFSHKNLISMGMHRWYIGSSRDKGHCVYLFPASWYLNIPEGTPICDKNGSLGFFNRQAYAPRSDAYEGTQYGTRDYTERHLRYGFLKRLDER